MKVYWKTISVETSRDHEYVDVTSELEQFVQESSVQHGLLNVFCPHTTAAVVVQEDDFSMHQDTEDALKRLFPLDIAYRHNMEGNLNATAHIKNQLVGPEVTLPVREGKLLLGTWQRVFFLELCEARSRRLELTLIGE